MNKLKKYILNILIGIDQLGSALTGGDCDETISSRIGKIKRENNGNIPWHYPIARILDSGLDRIDPNHSIDAIEEDEGKDAIIK